MNDSLRCIPEAIRLSRCTHAVLWQNIALALGIKAVFLALALFWCRDDLDGRHRRQGREPAGGRQRAAVAAFWAISEGGALPAFAFSAICALTAAILLLWVFQTGTTASKS
jgi:cation transport ATPase